MNSDARNSAIAALECVLALDLPYREGAAVMERNGFSEAVRFDGVTPTEFVSKLVAKALAEIKATPPAAKVNSYIEHDVLNPFTEELMNRCIVFGSCDVILNNGTKTTVSYIPEDDSGYDRFENNTPGNYRIWKLCGRSFTSETFNIVEFA